MIARPSGAILSISLTSYLTSNCGSWAKTEKIIF